MRIAFSLFKYFPYGGLQRDCIKIAQECLQRGHSVDMFTLQTQGEIPKGINLHLLPQQCWRNYKRYEKFADQVGEIVGQGDYAGLVGFNKMPHLDVYYAADPCFAAKVAERNLFYRYAGRTRSFLAAEKAVFGQSSHTEILLISEPEREQFCRFYGTAADRIHLLPPGIQRDRLAGDNYQQLRIAKRQELALGSDEKMVLMVGSGFKTKGLDRSLRALAALPQSLRQRVKLFVVGQDNINPFLRLAKKLGVIDQLHFLAGRDDVPELLFAADLLIHPAYRELAGMVLLEAMAANLPVLASGVCGYSGYIRDAQNGIVLAEPFSQEQMNESLMLMLTGERHHLWRSNGREYIEKHDIFSMPQRAVDVIEQALS